jgi:hypothetical protein
VEAISFFLDSIVLLIALYLGLRDDQRPAGTPQKSLFRTFDYDTIRPNAMRERQDQIELHPVSTGHRH